MTEEVIERTADFAPTAEAQWTLPTGKEAFLRWLDGTGLGEDDEARLVAFMDLPIAKKMPASLKDDLRQEGLLNG